MITRRVFLLFVAVVFGVLQFAPLPASALTRHNDATRQAAYTHCMATASAHPPSGAHVSGCTNSGVAWATGSSGYQACLLNSPYGETSSCWVSPWSEGTEHQYALGTNNGCPVGTTWNTTSKTCFDTAACLAKPALGFSKIVSAAGANAACSGGCRFEPMGSDMALGNDDGTYTSYTTGWKASGAACQVGDVAPNALSTAQDCVPAGAGQTFCVKANGDHCYTVTSTTKQICWKPRETGEKSSGDKLQVRNAGSSSTAPTTPPPAGDSLAPVGTSITKTATINGTTVVTTTTNYSTTYGSQTGSSDQGEPGDGSGSPAGGGSGDGNGDGTASGGDCPAAWSCSGDEVGCAILAEEHQQRCATEGLNGELQAGAGDYGGDGDAEDAFGTTTLGSDSLDSTGFLARSDCPAPVEIPGLTGLNLNAAVCPGASIWAIYMLIGAYIQAAYIIGRAASGGST